MIKSETEMYLPVQKYFADMGFKVDAEVRDCDVVATRDDIVVICELKKGFTIELMYQLVDRKKMTPYVYAVIPRPKNMRNRAFRKKIELLKALDCGLLVVLNSTKRVDLVLEPRGIDSEAKKYRRRGIEKEVEVRKMSLNLGGQTRRKIVTAHKESVIAALCYIEKYGQIKTRDCKENIKYVLQQNHYNWFVRLDRGVYTMNEHGRKALGDKDYKDIVEYYRNEVELCLK